MPRWLHVGKKRQWARNIAHGHGKVRKVQRSAVACGRQGSVLSPSSTCFPPYCLTWSQWCGAPQHEIVERSRDGLGQHGHHQAVGPHQHVGERLADERVQPQPDRLGRERPAKGRAEVQVEVRQRRLPALTQYLGSVDTAGTCKLKGNSGCLVCPTPGSWADGEELQSSTSPALL